jgi:peptide chain release factor 2
MWVSSYDAYSNSLDDLDTIYEFFKSGDATEKDVEDQHVITGKIIEEIEFKNMLNKPNDNLSCVLQLYVHFLGPRLDLALQNTRCQTYLACNP